MKYKPLSPAQQKLLDEPVRQDQLLLGGVPHGAKTQLGLMKMNNVEINERLDEICEGISSAEVLNGLHACRPGHPLGRGNPQELNFKNAVVLTAGRHDISLTDFRWLREQAGWE